MAVAEMKLKSVVPGVDWPGIPNARGCQLLALQFQLERSQWLCPDEIREQQCLLAWRLFRHAIDRVPFYRQRHQQLRRSQDAVDSVEEWRRLPVLARSDIQTNFKDLQCQLSDHGELSSAATTGSSGSPVVVMGTAVTRILWHALTLRHHLWHEHDFSGKLATIRTLLFPAPGVNRVYC